MTREEAKKIIDEWKCSNFPPDKIPEDKPVKMVGNWISTESHEEWWDVMYICSFCNGEMIGASKYCPECGRRMINENSDNH